MKPINRILGILLIAAAIGGLLFSLVSLAGTWVLKPRFTKTLDNSLDLVTTSLNATAQGLALTKESMKALVVSVNSVQATLDTAAKTIEDTTPAFDSVVTLLEDDLPSTVSAVQTSLNTAYETAQVIDGVLKTLTFFNRDAYNPEVPLHTALEDISSSLNSLPTAFNEMSVSLADTRHNMQIIQVDLALVKDAIRQIETSLTQYEDVIDDYLGSIAAVQTQLEALRKNLPRTLNYIAGILTVFFLWMIIAQFGLLTQGWELFKRQEVAPRIPSTQVETTESEEEEESQEESHE